MAFSESIKQEVREKARHTCAWCRQRGSVDIHHIIPQKEGGSDTLENAAPLCKSCHGDFGNNPDHRKRIVEMRDQLYKDNETIYQAPVIIDLNDQIERHLAKFLSNKTLVETKVGNLSSEHWSFEEIKKYYSSEPIWDYTEEDARLVKHLMKHRLYIPNIDLVDAESYDTLVSMLGGKLVDGVIRSSVKNFAADYFIRPMEIGIHCIHAIVLNVYFVLWKISKHSDLNPDSPGFFMYVDSASNRLVMHARPKG